MENSADLPHLLSSARTGVVETARLSARRYGEQFLCNVELGSERWERKGRERETYPDTWQDGIMWMAREIHRVLKIFDLIHVTNIAKSRNSA